MYLLIQGNVLDFVDQKWYKIHFPVWDGHYSFCLYDTVHQLKVLPLKSMSG